jgi:hypothetical protein
MVGKSTFLQVEISSMLGCPALTANIRSMASLEENSPTTQRPMVAMKTLETEFLTDTRKAPAQNLNGLNGDNE